MAAAPGRVTGPITGPRTVGHLEHTAQARDIRLGADQLTRPDEVFPLPGGPVPEAYAWGARDGAVPDGSLLTGPRFRVTGERTTADIASPGAFIPTYT
ncbi:hypothetical protein Shyhy02_28050 [Streptomyces hygroscopicus subsp. hygroscopicus]|nr:hypothetical protein Shyhy02_28050 [Streptomyces hygroscopicus subsp. hygroscopicus]